MNIIQSAFQWKGGLFFTSRYTNTEFSVSCFYFSHYSFSTHTSIANATTWETKAIDYLQEAFWTVASIFFYGYISSKVTLPVSLPVIPLYLLCIIFLQSKHSHFPDSIRDMSSLILIMVLVLTQFTLRSFYSRFCFRDWNFFSRAYTGSTMRTRSSAYRNYIQASRQADRASLWIAGAPSKLNLGALMSIIF